MFQDFFFFFFWPHNLWDPSFLTRGTELRDLAVKYGVITAGPPENYLKIFLFHFYFASLAHLLFRRVLFNFCIFRNVPAFFVIVVDNGWYLVWFCSWAGQTPPSQPPTPTPHPCQLLFNVLHLPTFLKKRVQHPETPSSRKLSEKWEKRRSKGK